MPRKRAVLLGGLVAATLAAVATGNACSGGLVDGRQDTGNTASGTDARPEASRYLPPWDAGVFPDDVTLADPETGWRYLSEMPGCDAQVPIVPQASMKPLVWVACPSDKAECRRFDTTGWRVDTGTRMIGAASVSLDKRWLAFIRPLSGDKTAEWDLYDRSNLSPVNAWLLNGHCYVQPVLGASRVTLFVDTFTDSPTRIAYASGPIPAGALQPAFVTLKPQPKLLWLMPSASDTKIAFNITAGLGADTVRVGETTFKHASGNKWFVPLVVGPDVFVSNEYGSTGWNRELRINQDGTSTVFREMQGRHISHFRTDGSTWFWVEAYGDADYTHFDQPRAEVWSAPYTSDPATLAATARKLAQVDGATTFDGTEVALDGYFAVGTYGPYLWIVRGMDGAVKKLDIATLYGPGPVAYPRLGMQQPVFVSQDEVWGILAGEHGSPDDLAFARFQLGSWP